MTEGIPGENPALNRDKPDSICVAVSTYKKNAALRVWLETFHKFMDPMLVQHVVITDDNNGEAREVFEEFEAQYFGKLDYVTGPRAGIAKNKNRGLLYFMTKTEDTHVILSDDDIQFVGSGIERRLLDCGYGHITGYLGDYNDPLTGSNFFKQFVPFASTDDLYFCTGSQGIFLWAWREVIENVGYMDTDWKGMYGYEHAVWSMRINRAYGCFPEYYPILQRCEDYFQTQMIGNNYGPDYVIDKKTKQPLVVTHEDGSTEQILINRDQYIKRKKEIYDGLYIYKGNPGVSIS